MLLQLERTTSLPCRRSLSGRCQYCNLTRFDVVDYANSVAPELECTRSTVLLTSPMEHSSPRSRKEKRIASRSSTDDLVPSPSKPSSSKRRKFTVEVLVYGDDIDTASGEPPTTPEIREYVLRELPNISRDLQRPERAGNPAGAARFTSMDSDTALVRSFDARIRALETKDAEKDAQINSLNNQIALSEPLHKAQKAIILRSWATFRRDSGMSNVNYTAITAGNVAAHEPDVRSTIETLNTETATVQLQEDFPKVFGTEIHIARKLTRHKLWYEMVNLRALLAFCPYVSGTADDIQHTRLADNLTATMATLTMEELTKGLKFGGTLYNTLTARKNELAIDCTAFRIRVKAAYLHWQ